MGTGARRGQGGGMSELQPHPMRQLRRARRGRIVAGVCSGIGEYVGVDPNIVRIALAIASFFGGLGIGVYAVAWLLIPEEGKSTSIVQDLTTLLENITPMLERGRYPDKVHGTKIAGLLRAVADQLDV